MLKVLITHQWREFARFAFTNDRLGLSIVSLLLKILFTLNLLVLLLFIDKIILAFMPSLPPIQAANLFVLGAAALSIPAGIFWYKQPYGSFQPFAHLPIRRSVLKAFMLLGSLRRQLVGMLLLIIPMLAWQVVGSETSALMALQWCLTWMCTVLSVHFVTIMLRQYLVLKTTYTVLAFLAALAGFYFFVKTDISQVPTAAATAMDQLLHNPYWLIIPVLLCPMVAYLAYVTLDQVLYQLLDRQPSQPTKRSWGFRLKGGQISSLIQLELNLILRNQRPRQFILMSLAYIFLLNFGVFRAMKDTESPVLLAIMGSTFVLMAVMQYSQLLLSWDSKHFSMLLTKLQEERLIFEAKFRLHILLSFTGLILLLPLVAIDPYFLLCCSGFFLFFIGIGQHIPLFLCSYSARPIDLRSSVLFNHQGVNIFTYILTFSVAGLPVLFFLPFYLIWGMNVAIMALSVAGVIGLIFKKPLLLLSINAFRRRRYRLAATLT